jgi:hypothetical protein
MPDDAEIHVGAQHQWTLPKPYVEATEKYGGQTRLVKQPGGLYKLETRAPRLPPMSLTRCRATSGACSRTWAARRSPIPRTALAT